MSDATNQSLQSLAALKGVQVTYRRGSTIAIPVTAIPAKTTIEGVDGDGTVTITRMRDWLVEADDLADGGDLLTPEAGDLVELVTGTKTLTYQVDPPANGAMVYGEIGDFGDWLRIHTQKA